MAGNTAEAIEVSEDLFEIRRREAENPEAGPDALNGFAWELLTWEPPELRDPAAALPFAERAVALTSNADRADALDTLALALHLNGRNDEALEAQREALSLVDTDNPARTSPFVARLAKYLDSEGDTGEEIRFVVLEHARNLESASDDVDQFVGNIGGFSNRLEDERLHRHSEFARREALTIVQDRWHGEPEAMAGLYYRLGRALLHQGKVKDAESVLREGVARAREAESFDGLNLNQINLAEALAHMGRYREVRAIAAEVRDRYETGADQNAVYNFYQRDLGNDAKRLLGVAALGLGQTSAAEPLLLEATRWSERSLPPDSWRRARAQSAWGECLVALGRYDQAESTLLNAHEVLVAQVGEKSTAAVDTTRRLVRLYKAWGKPSKAAKYLK